MNCEQANKIDLVNYLYSLGFRPQKVRNADYWYLSPFRSERTPSFKINRKLNVWYDHAEGKGGNLVDFGTAYFKCGIHQFLYNISTQYNSDFPFHPQQIASEKKETSSKIIIHSERPITSGDLLVYLESRCIPFEIASKYCSEVEFELYHKKGTAIGFKNNSGGFELRSKQFKGSSSPKDVTLIDTNCNEISVFEGAFSFLSWQVVKENGQQSEQENSLILNSLSFFEKQVPILNNKYASINLFLDRDAAGIKAVNKVKSNPKFRNKSYLYEGYKDFNEKLVKLSCLRHQKRFGRGM